MGDFISSNQGTGDFGRMGRVWPIVALLFFLALVPRVIFPLATSVCYDEAAAKDSGAMYALLKSRDFHSEGWAQFPYLPFYKYVYGIVPQMIFGSNPSDPDDLAGARWMGALMGSGIVVMTFLVGTRLMPVPAAIIAAWLLAFVPTVLGHDRLAMHDAPSRLLGMMGWWFVLRWRDWGTRRDLVTGAIFSGLAITFFHRTGVTSGLALGLWLVWLLKMRAIPMAQSLRTLALFSLVLVGAFLASVWLFWPYMWFRPWELLRWYANPAATAGAGASLEFWFGQLQRVPRSYYVVALIISTPPLTLLAFAAWQVQVARKSLRDPSSMAIALLFWISLLVCSMTLRQGLAHYLQILFPALCLGAAATIWNIRCWIVSKYPGMGPAAGWLVISIPIVMEIAACASVGPYFFEYFNVFTGGGANVTQKKLFSQGTYGEAIDPLFDYVRQKGMRDSTVLCRLGPWPGLGSVNKRLGSAFLLQGHQGVDPLGARYILRAGFERSGEFYRYEPDPQLYRKVMDVLADGGSLGDVWERREDAAVSGLLYADDFASPQCMRFGVGGKNVNLNPFSDGKLYSITVGEPSTLVMKLPGEIFRNRSILRCEADVQMREGQFRIMAGTDPKKMSEIAHIEKGKGWVKSSELAIAPGKDVFIELDWITTHAWDGKPFSFWEADWVDALRIYGK